MKPLHPLLLVLLAACGAQQSDSTPESAPSTQQNAAQDGQSAEAHVHGEAGQTPLDGAHHHGFDDPEAWAARWEGPERDAWQNPVQVIEWMMLEPGQTAVDIGAGTGYFLPYLSEAVGETGHVYCADIEPAMVDHLTTRIDVDGVTNASAHLAALDDPRLEPGAIDRILLVNTWHHVEGRDVYAGVLLEALAPGGTITIVEYNDTVQPGPPAEMRMSPEEVMSEFNEAGYQSELLGHLDRQYVVRVIPNR
ncbi:MAG: putative methyltransferase [Bradymonadia bacterium]|jgi:predicted methyltransferase